MDLEGQLSKVIAQQDRLLNLRLLEEIETGRLRLCRSPELTGLWSGKLTRCLERITMDTCCDAIILSK